MDTMHAKVSMVVDCLGRPAEVEVSSVIRTGVHELDLALFHAMTLAVRNFADEVTRDQERIITEMPQSLDASVREVIDERDRLREEVETHHEARHD